MAPVGDEDDVFPSLSWSWLALVADGPPVLDVLEESAWFWQQVNHYAAENVVVGLL